jgi:hypothetical protein
MALAGVTPLMLAACGAPPASHPTSQATDARQTSPGVSPASPASPAPGRAAAVPNRATAVTLSLKPDMNAHAKPPGPATITDPAAVRRLVSLIGGLPAFPPGTYSCPMDAGARLTLTFTAARGGPALAVATVSLQGCEGTGLTVDGRAQPGRGPVGGGRQTATQVLKISGEHWNLGRYLA